MEKTRKRRRKRIRWGMGVFLGLLVVFSLLNLNFLKDRLETAVSSFLKRPFHVNGNIKLSSIGMYPAVVLRDVTIGVVTDKEPVIGADSLAVAPSILAPSRKFLVRIGNLTYDGRLLGNYDLPVSLHPGGVSIDGLQGGVGRADLEGHARYIDNKLSVSLDLEDLPYQKVIEGVEGRIKGNIRLEGNGADSAWLIRTMNGSFTLVGGPGKIESRKAVNIWAKGLLAGLLPGQKAEAELRCAVADFEIRDGFAHSRTIIVDTDAVTVFGKGTIDLERQYVDITFNPKPKDASLLSLVTPLQVTGKVGNLVVIPVGHEAAKKLGGLLLGIVNPAMVILPLIEMGSGKEGNPCVKFLETQPGVQ